MGQHRQQIEPTDYCFPRRRSSTTNVGDRKDAIAQLDKRKHTVITLLAISTPHACLIRHSTSIFAILYSRRNRSRGTSNITNSEMARRTRALTAALPCSCQRCLVVASSHASCSLRKASTAPKVPLAFTQSGQVSFAATSNLALAHCDSRHRTVRGKSFPVTNSQCTALRAPAIALTMTAVPRRPQPS
jgi:hypothetical protein